jgi:hypothetical protein
MRSIEVGSHVTHKLTGQGMTVKRIAEGIVATCVKDIPEPWTSLGTVYPGDIAICLVENLIPDEKPTDKTNGSDSNDLASRALVPSEQLFIHFL